MQSIKERVGNVAASAKSGMAKTKATMQEKMEKMTAHNPTEKEMATERKQEKIHNAELNKLEAREHNAAARQAARDGGSHTYTTGGVAGNPTGAHQMSAMPGHGTGEPAGGHVVEGCATSHPVGTATGTGRPTTAHDTHVGGAATNTGYGTGGAYNC